MRGRATLNHTYPSYKYFERRIDIYKNKYLQGRYNTLNEASTRLIVNHLLSDVFLYKELDQYKVEPFIGGMFFDYAVQANGKILLVIEVKQRGMKFNFDHILQVMTYALSSRSRFAMVTDGDMIILFELNPIYKRFGLKVKLKLRLSEVNKNQMKLLLSLISINNLVAGV